MKGYKVFNPDWTCRGFQYEIGKTYKIHGNPKCCKIGFHFCENAVDCFNYYSFTPKNKVAEIEAIGKIDTSGDKSCTNKITIVREIRWEEVLKIVNIGKCCTGMKNSGDRNSGNYNSGSYNSGSWNSGSCNSGDFNKASYSSGCFNTEETKIYMFNKPSDWTYEDWEHSEARALFLKIYTSPVMWIPFEIMTDEEKNDNPEAKTTGGYLKKQEKSECMQKWWKGLSKHEKSIIKAIPNFDADIFCEITGIKTEN